MVSPLYLTLLIGPMEPLPAPKPLIDALVDVEVTESATGRTGFQLTFTIADKGILETFFLLAGGSPLPIDPAAEPVPEALIRAALEQGLARDRVRLRRLAEFGPFIHIESPPPVRDDAISPCFS